VIKLLVKTAENLMHRHHILPYILVKLLNLTLHYCYLPTDFGVSYTVPLPKVNDFRTKSMSRSDFRGIAMSSIISKVFEYCILDRYYCYSISNDSHPLILILSLTNVLPFVLV